ncbi:hypothetical protein, partial [Solemya velum gill symbiont]|uniref:hypothetical protein n=1 Tax=Solemya velum gill symbiont TaxID=2340 RepID=UPI001C4E141B
MNSISASFGVLTIPRFEAAEIPSTEILRNKLSNKPQWFLKISRLRIRWHFSHYWRKFDIVSLPTNPSIAMALKIMKKCQQRGMHHRLLI